MIITWLVCYDHLLFFFFQDDREKDKDFCWKTCGGVLTEGPKPATPYDLQVEYTPSYTVNVTWDGNGDFYLIEIAKDNIHLNEYVDEVVSFTKIIKLKIKFFKFKFLNLIFFLQLTMNNSLINFEKSKDSFCDSLSFRVAMIKPGGVSDFSEIFELPAPAPDIIQNITVESMRYIVSNFTMLTEYYFKK